MPQLALVVDDEAHVRLFVTQMLTKLGVANCVPAGDAEQGLQAFNAHRPGLVMIDLHLPGGVSGVEMLKRIREIDTDTYAIILTCEASSQSVMNALSAGADGYIRKDTPKDQIMAQIQEILADPEEE